jgi:hypothetical protein
MLAWVKKAPKNEYAFWVSIYPKLLPMRVEGQGPGGEIELNVALTDEELDRRLEEHGLPRFVFGTREPPLPELEAVNPNGKDTNGSGSDRGGQHEYGTERISRAQRNGLTATARAPVKVRKDDLETPQIAR